MYLRPVTIQDFDLVISWAQNPELDEYFRRTPPVCDWAEPNKFMMQMGDKYIVVKEDETIGLLSMGIVDQLSRNVEWGLLLIKKEKEDSTKVEQIIRDVLFNKLGCNRLFCRILSHREGIKRNLEKAGYKHEGTLRKSCLYRGKLVDECLYSLLKEE
jgi:RimJ/RimL family protein N-acetyltransferase